MEGGKTTDSVRGPNPSKFKWTIQNFSKLTVQRLYSDTFVAGGCKWCLLIIPKGGDGDYLSMYLKVADSTTLPRGWSRDAKYSLAVVNQFSDKATVKKETQKVFDEKIIDWGFTNFIPLSTIKNPAERYLVKDTLAVEAEVLVYNAVHYSAVDSVKEAIKLEPKAPKTANEAPLPSKEPKVEPPTVTDTPLTTTKPLNQTEGVIQPTASLAHQEAKKEPAPSPPNTVTEETKIPPKDPASEPLKSTADVQTICRALLTQLSTRNKTKTSASRDEISVSSNTLSPAILQQQKKALKGFFSMSLEDIQQVNAFGYIEGIVNTLDRQTNNLREKMILEDLASRLAEFKESIPNAATSAETAQARRTSLRGKVTDLDTKLRQRQQELSSLEKEFSRISEEEAKLQAALQSLITQKSSTALKLEKSNEETSKDLEEWRNLEGEIKQADAEWLGAEEKLALANARWKLFKEDLGLGKA